MTTITISASTGRSITVSARKLVAVESLTVLATLAVGLIIGLAF